MSFYCGVGNRDSGSTPAMKIRRSNISRGSDLFNGSGRSDGRYTERPFGVQKMDHCGRYQIYYYGTPAEKESVK